MKILLKSGAGQLISHFKYDLQDVSVGFFFLLFWHVHEFWMELCSKRLKTLHAFPQILFLKCQCPSQSEASRA